MKRSPSAAVFDAVVASLSLALTLGVSTAALAQAIERNLPPAEVSQPQEILAPNSKPGSQDARPIGPALKGLLLLGPGDVVRTAPVTDVVPGLVPRLNRPKAWSLLRPFLGRPLSRKLIAEIEATIARYYRQAGYPFVSISTPPQMIGGGVLQVRVVEFHDGTVAVTGVKGKAAKRVRDAVRLQPGDPVSAPDLSADLDWLNRNPFHHVEAIFSPGDALGRTDLQLQTTQTKPWQVYAGYANSGSSATGYDRYLFGGQVGGLLGAGSLLSYQFTASPDFFDDHGRAFGDTDHPQYLSHGLRAAIPFAPRQEIEASFDHVESNTTSAASAGPFAIRQDTDELSLGYRTSVSNFTSLPGDLSLGLEAKHETRTTFFAGVDVLETAEEVYQAYLGWSGVFSDARGRTSIDLTLHDSPGGLSPLNSGAGFNTFSNGRLTSAAYAYVNLQANRNTRLPKGWTLTDEIIAQYSGSPLPDTEQLGIGGQDLVRGYTLDDGAYDTAIVSRNELRPPAFAVLPKILPHAWRVADQLSPFAFVDAASGSENLVHRSAHPISTGLGADYLLGSHLFLNVTGAYALEDSLVTKAGALMLETKATLTF
jgi:hemolysin activation/secretion protein